MLRPKGIPDHARMTVGCGGVVRIVAGCIGDGPAGRKTHGLVKRTAVVVPRAPQAREPGAIAKKGDMAIRRGQLLQAVVEALQPGIDIGNRLG